MADLETRNELKALYDQTLESMRVKHILVITKSKRDFKKIEKSLSKQEEFVLELCQDLEKAGKLIESMSTTACILDIDGSDSYFEFFLKISRQHPEMPIVVVSKKNDDRIAMQVMKKGAQDYIVKDPLIMSQGLGRALRYAIERKTTEKLTLKAMSLEHSVLRELLEYAPILMMRIDRVYKLRDFNSAFCDATGLNRSQVMGKNIFEVIPDMDHGRISDIIRKRVPYEVEALRINRVGARRYRNVFWQIIGWPVELSFTEIEEAMILAMDVTQRITLERQRDDFYAALAHDIRNPIVGEEKVLDALLSNSTYNLTEESREMLTTLKQGNQSLLLMLNNMLNIYRMGSPDEGLLYERVLLDELVLEQVSELESIGSQFGVRIETTIPDVVPPILVDRTAAQRVLVNLLHNAFKFAPRNSTVGARVHWSSESVSISINNDGEPLDREQLKTVFEMFGQTEKGKKLENSSGMGLYLSKKLVERMNGSICCVSDYDTGTTFTISFPRES